MKTRALGKAGIQVSAVGLGCNALGGRIDFEASRAVVHKALDAGITLFDTANSYGNRYGAPGGSEACLGRILGTDRKRIVLATKFGNQSHKHESIPVEGASRREVMAAVEASLQRLQTDWIDLYQIHHPDPGTPIEETLRALEELVRSGKVRFIGCSNFPAWRLVEADWTARHLGLPAFVTCQSEYSVLARGIERELLPVMEQYCIGLLPTYPLAAGLLTGKYERDAPLAEGRLSSAARLARKYLTGSNWEALERLERFCAARGRTLLELAVGWLLAHPVLSSVIAGATTPAQVESNAAAAGWELTTQDMAEINRALSSEQALAAA